MPIFQAEALHTFKVPLPLSHVFALWQNYSNYEHLITPKYIVKQVPSVSPLIDHILCKNLLDEELCFDVSILRSKYTVTWKTVRGSVTPHEANLLFLEDIKGTAIRCHFHTNTPRESLHVAANARKGFRSLPKKLKENIISFPGGDNLPLSLLSDDVFTMRFHELARTWIEETSFHSFVSRRVLHPAFRAILSMGPRAIPLILDELQRTNNSDWLWALEPMTEKNPAIAAKTIEDAIAAWIAWDRE